jgi:nucleobase:cation symporter-1, NCS1 family
LVTALLLAQGGLLALGLILLDELDNAYGDVYSSAVSLSSLTSGLSLRQWGVTAALLCTALACVLPMHSLEPFLLTLSSIFVPLYGVIWGSMFRASHEPAKPVLTAGSWVLGVVVFQGIAQFMPQIGATLPTLLLTFLIAFALQRPKTETSIQ